MVDPAVIGVVGTASGAVLGVVGATLQARITAKKTEKREEVARLFEKRTRVYADYLGNLYELETQIASRYEMLQEDDPDSAFAAVSRERRDVRAAFLIVAPQKLRECDREVAASLRLLIQSLSVSNMQRMFVLQFLEMYRANDGTSDWAKGKLIQFGRESLSYLFDRESSVPTDERVIQILETSSKKLSLFTSNDPARKIVQADFSANVRKLADLMRQDLGIHE